jgi:hypothetical protein
VPLTSGFPCSQNSTSVRRGKREKIKNKNKLKIQHLLAEALGELREGVEEGRVRGLARSEVLQTRGQNFALAVWYTMAMKSTLGFIDRMLSSSSSSPSKTLYATFCKI